MLFLKALGWRGLLIIVLVALIAGQQFMIKGKNDTIKELNESLNTTTVALGIANENTIKQNEAIKIAGDKATFLQAEIEEAKAINEELEKRIKFRRTEIVKIPVAVNCEAAIVELRTFMKSTAMDWNRKGEVK